MSAFPVENISLGVRSAIRESLFFDSPFSELSEVRYKEKFGTACWMFQPPHVVVIGLDIYAEDRLLPGLSERQLQDYAANFYHHEMGHARFTSRGGAAVSNTLQDAGVPFRLYNLFEDARIEVLYVKATGRRFKWLQFEKPPDPHTAQELFFALIQSEGEYRHARSGEGELFSRVRDYYRQALACQSSEELIPLLECWVAEFPEPPGNASRFNGELDIAHADEDVQAEFLSGCMADSASATSDNTSGPRGAGTEGVLLGAGGVERNALPDRRRTQALAAILKRVFQSRLRRTVNARPGKRVSARHFLRGVQKFYLQPRALPGEPEELLVVLDCSGSMNGKPMREAQILLSALSELATMGFVRVTVLLSATLDGQPRWQCLTLPLRDAEIATIHACGAGEALQATLLANLTRVAAAHRVLVFTDAEFTDEKVDKPMLNKFGIYTTGLYVGDRARQPVLDRYFDRSIVRNSIDDIGLALVQKH